MNSENPELDGVVPEATDLDYQEEWLSAYLDDELTPAQRRIVEDRLVADPEAARDLEGLQQVRSLVQQLPKWSGPDWKLPGESLLDRDADMAADLSSDGAASIESPEPLSDVRAAAEEKAVLVMPSRHQKVDSQFTSAAVWRRWLLPLSTVAGIILILGLGYLFQPMIGESLSMSRDRSPAAPTSAAGGLADQIEDKSSREDLAPLPQADTSLGPSVGPGMPPELPGLSKAGDTDFFSANAQLQPSSMAEANVPAENLAAGYRDGLGQDAAAQAGLASRGLPDARGGARPQLPVPLPESLAESSSRAAELEASSLPADSAVLSIEQARVQSPGQSLTNEQVAQTFGAAIAPTVTLAAPPRMVYAARSSSWTAEEMEQELAVNDALESLWGSSTINAASDELQSPQASSATFEGDLPRNAPNNLSRSRAAVEKPPAIVNKAPAPIVVAALPAELDAAVLFADVVTEQELARVQPPAKDMEGVADAIPDDPQRRASSGVAIGRSSIVLFLDRRQAESILARLDRPTASEDGSVPNAAEQSETETMQRYSWILPSKRLGDSLEEKQPTDGSERVILLMNARN